MKKLLLALGLASGSLFAQTSDQINMADGKVNNVYYSFENGEVSTSKLTDWDLAFSGGGRGTTVRINGGMGAKLYVADASYDDWSTLDFTGYTTWDVLDNYSNSDWSEDAFSSAVGLGTPPPGVLDLGWGTYNFATHKLNGLRLFVLVTADGTAKKLKIDKLLSDVWTFVYADLDGSNEVSKTMDKADFSDRNFGYFDIELEQELDLEPASASWDFVLTKYWKEVAPGYSMGVTGIKVNAGRKSGEMRVSDLDFDAMTEVEESVLEDDIEAIGYDWKSVESYSPPTYAVVDTVAYFVESGDLTYKLRFDAFQTGDGTVDFTYDQVGTILSVDAAMTTEFIAYPMPAKDVLNIDFSSSSEANVTVYDALGSVVYSGITTKSLTINTSSFSSGAYVLAVVQDEKALSKQFIVE
jgi:hypothetical protein